MFDDIKRFETGAPQQLDWFRQLLYWPEADRKILFGSDVHADELGASIQDYARVLEGIGWTDDQIANVMHRNARVLLAPA